MGVSYNPKTVTDGLVLYLDAANPKSYSGTGIDWYDMSGYGNHGTLVNGPIYSEGSIIFDGVDDYATLGVRSSLDLTEEETTIYWCYPTNLDPGRRSHVGNRHGGFLTIYGSQLGYEGVNDSGSWQNNLYTANGVIQINTWQQVCFTFKANETVKLYRNGSFLNSKAVVGSQRYAESAYLIGTEAFSGWGDPMYFAGRISVVQNYNRVLSGPEIQQNFNALRGRYGI